MQGQENWHNVGVLQRLKDSLGGATVTVLEESLPEVMQADGKQSRVSAWQPRVAW